MKLRTALCDLLGIEYPILQSGMRRVAGPELAAQVSNAGGLGILAGLLAKGEDLRTQIRRVRELTDRPFGVNLFVPGSPADSVAVERYAGKNLEQHALGREYAAARVFAVACAIAAFALLWVVLNHTTVGRSMRGAAQSPTAALMVGINPTRVARLTVVLGCALAGLAGCALTFVYNANPTVGIPVVFTAFAIIIIGGLGSLAGTILTAFGLGLAQSYVGGLVSTTLQDAVSFSLMMLVLFLRPQGLFGREVRL